MKKFIEVHKANVHNLKNVSVKIPRDKLTVITGPSGSGKSSLAFDTIYAEGQRRYIESLSSYARQFLGQIDPPEVESITGLSPSIAIDQKTKSTNPRSTVGTITEVYDYMRVLFAKVSTPHSPISGEKLQALNKQEIVDEIMGYAKKSKVFILAPIIRDQKGEHKELIAKYQSMGFSRIRINGELYLIDDEYKIAKTKRNTIEIVVDRLVLKNDSESRLFDSIEQALKFGKGIINVLIDDEEISYSENYYSQKDAKSYPPLDARLFSFNSPNGACPKCSGLGKTKEFSKLALVTDDSLPLLDGAIALLHKKNTFWANMIRSIAEAEKIDLTTPYKKLKKSFIDIIFNGSSKKYTYKFESENSKFHFSKKFAGLMSLLDKKHKETSSEKIIFELESFMVIETCSGCSGDRLAPYPLAATIENHSIMDIAKMSLEKSFDFFMKLKFKKKSQKIIADKLLKEIRDRLKFLNDVGLGYLTLNREANTLSGGESQRIRLATQIGSALSGVLYVLDEPSIGLHQRDNMKLIETLINLRDLGNTLLVIEHDEETMRHADYIIDIGPHAGVHGGEVVAEGNLSAILKKKGITSDYLSGREKIEIPKTRRTQEDYIKLIKAKENNLKDVDLNIPLNNLVCVTGVSGSGKSTLIHKVLTPAIKNSISSKSPRYPNFKKLEGADQVDSIIQLDQSPIGRTPKSNPATYSGLFDHIRKLFSNTNEAKMKGYGPGRFSFNVKGGRCDTCEGHGVIKIEMHFLPDVYVQCESCEGKRYNDETLLVQYRGKNIFDILNMTIEEGVDFFQNHTSIKRILSVMNDVGLGYMRLGQPATTLSGGEAQRLKLSKELAKKTRGHCLYLLDEPTTGLHFKDIKVLLKAINKLVNQGNTVLVIEHNLDVIKCADYIIDLGPEGGDKGGEIVVEGQPEKILKNKKSHTAKYLKDILKK